MRYRSKPWHGAPPAAIPATVAVDRVLARRRKKSRQPAARVRLRAPPENGIVFRRDGGGGSDERYTLASWIRPIPDEGPLTVVCEWPAHGIPATRLDVGGDALRDAARRATVVFSEDHLPEEPDEPGERPVGGGWSSYVSDAPQLRRLDRHRRHTERASRTSVPLELDLRWCQNLGVVVEF